VPPETPIRTVSGPSFAGPCILLVEAVGAQPENLDVEMQYVWSPRYIDAPVLRDRDTDASTATGDLGKADSGLDERLFYVTDANFNVTALVQGTPGDADLGKVLERYVYDPYGKVLVLNGADGVDPDTTAGGDDEEWTTDTDGASDVANEILFCGYRLDAETSLYHVRHRMYHPTLGRWLQRDPLGYVDGMSLYAYCGNSPESVTDPMGLAEMMTLLYKPDEMRTETRTLEWRAEWKDPIIVLLGDDVDDNPPPKTEKECPTNREESDFSWWGAFLSAVARNVGTSLANTAADMAMPWRRVERTVADHEADIARGESAFDAGLNALTKNTPGLSVGWGLGEAIEGRTKGGVDHGRRLNFGERGGRIGNFAAWEAGAFAWGVARWNSPTLNARVGITDKITRQMGPRGWTKQQIGDAIKSGQQIRAINKATGNPAIRYVHPKTGQSVVVDTVTNEVIHVGGPGFKYGPSSGDVP